MALPDFKSRLKEEIKPHKFRHFSKGSKIGNKLLTRLRLERSDLNLHKFTIGQSETPECFCHSKQESSQLWSISYLKSRIVVINCPMFFPG